MRKALSVLLTLCLLMQLPLPALAAGRDTTGVITRSPSGGTILDPTRGPVIDPTGGSTVDPTRGPSVDSTGGSTVDPTRGASGDTTEDSAVDSAGDTTVEKTKGPDVTSTRLPNLPESALQFPQPIKSNPKIFIEPAAMEVNNPLTLSLAAAKFPGKPAQAAGGYPITNTVFIDWNKSDKSWWFQWHQKMNTASQMVWQVSNMPYTGGVADMEKPLGLVANGIIDSLSGRAEEHP